MRVKFLATWGLLVSSAVGSPMPRPEPMPEPKPVPMPVPGGGLSTNPDEPLNNAHKIAIAGLVTGTILTSLTTIYNECLARYASRAATNEKAVQAMYTAFNNYMGELGTLNDPQVDELARALSSRLWDIQNRYAGMLMNTGRRQIGAVYEAQGNELQELIREVKTALAEAKERVESRRSEKGKGKKGSSSRSRHGYSSDSSSGGDSSRYQSFVKRAINVAQENSFTSGSDYKKRDAGSKTGSILRLRNLIPRVQLPHFFGI
ncbi:hypothetical protein PspLS_09256 [Pyricularia sp. CBS 133598]|nr:hypothetical protein PspLS_09256 [Pyricularia sp. CBS 133598]